MKRKWRTGYGVARGIHVQGWREVGGKMRMKVGTFVADDGSALVLQKGWTLRFLLRIIARTNARERARNTCMRIRARIFLCTRVAVHEERLRELRGSQSRWLDELIVLRGWEKLSSPRGLKFLASLYDEKYSSRNFFLFLSEMMSLTLPIQISNVRKYLFLPDALNRETENNAKYLVRNNLFKALKAFFLILGQCLIAENFLTLRLARDNGTETRYSLIVFRDVRIHSAWN